MRIVNISFPAPEDDAVAIRKAIEAMTTDQLKAALGITPPTPADASQDMPTPAEAEAEPKRSRRKWS